MFCCRSCLKGEGENTEYYEVLGIEDKKRATTESIKQAYKKQSLLLHPDRMARKGIEVTKEHNERFQKLKEAYDTLSDPRKRRLYDQLGSTGVMLVESPDKIDPKVFLKNFQKNKKDRFTILLLILLIFGALITLPVLFSLKCDGRIQDAPWLAIWTPMWIIDSVLLLSSILVFLEPDHEPEEGEEPVEKIPLYIKVLYLVQTCSMVLTQIFVLAKLDEVLNFSWGKIFIPWYVYEAFSVLEKIPMACNSIPDPDFSAIPSNMENPEEEKVQKMMLATEVFRKQIERHAVRFSVGAHLLRVWLAIFLAYQLDSHDNWNWGLVLLPMWSYFAMEFVNGYTLRSWGNSLLAGIDMNALESGIIDDVEVQLKAQHGQELVMAGSVGLCVQLGPLLMALLLISRLEVSFFSTFIIIFPVFAVLGCCFCAVCCTFCCLSNVDTDSMYNGNEGPAEERTASDDPAQAMMGSNAYEPPSPSDIETGNATSNVSPVYGTFSSDTKVDGSASPPTPVTTNYQTTAKADKSHENDIDID